ncbi:Germin-like protein subfamily 1 member 20 [Citrus sinensis]|nr:Germin-like protein subfamily 1 member 20 [Citrus sinensis]
MKGVQFPVASVLLVLACSLAIASDPSRLQDFSVAINDFKFKTIANQVGSTVTTTNVEQIPGHNTTRHIYSLYRLRGKQRPNPPHSHHCAPEILVILEGTLYVGFVTSNQLNNTLHQSPEQRRCFQNPGVITIADVVFGSDPPIDPYALARAFQLDPYVVKALQAKFGAN